MKKLFPIVMLVSSTIFGQSPQAFNYQSVVRDVSGDAIPNQGVSFRISIEQGSPGGVLVYQESFAVTTDARGLVSIAVGTGTVLSGGFAGIAWGSGPYFMKTELDPLGGTAYTDLGSVQLLSVPYALFAGNAGGGNTLDLAYDQGGLGAGRIINADAGEVEIKTSTPNGIALRTTNAVSGTAILANSLNATNTFSTIQSGTNSTSNLASAIVGSTTGAAWAVSGQVDANATAESALYGSNLRTTGGHGVLGIGVNGVVGQTGYTTGYAVYGENFDNIGVSGNGIGVAGRGYFGVLGEDRYLGGVPGAYGVFSNGDMGASGLKSFVIDHPLDPENKFLKHFSIESNEVLNVYRGNVVFDNNGEAIVQMPDYYESINTDASYQLTPVGAAMQLYIKEELADGQFVIAGGTAGGKASWTVHALRNDPYLQQYPEKRMVEIQKREGQKGKHLIPKLHSAGDDKRMIGSAGTEPQEQTPLQLGR